MLNLICCIKLSLFSRREIYMKKASKMLAVLLVLIMALTICGCGGNDSGKDLLGTWSLDYDMATLLAGELGDEFSGFNAPLIMSICFEFKEDGTYTMYGEPESFKANFNTWLEEFLTFSTDMLYEQFDVSKEEADAAFEKQYGMSISDFMRQTIDSELDVDALLDEMTTSGKYETSGDKLYMADENGEIDKNAYDVFTVSGDTLKLELPAGADPSQGEILPGLEYPLEFKKAN